MNAAEAECLVLRARVAELEHYVGTAANRLGVADPGNLAGPHLERVGEASLAAIERLRAGGA